MKELTYADKYTKEAVDVLISEIGLIILAQLAATKNQKKHVSGRGT